MDYQITPERIFFIYAFPAMESCIGGKLKENEISKFKELVVNGRAPSRIELEKLFPTAFERMALFFKKKEFWNLENVKKYWLEGHNKFVEDYCKVYLAEILDVNDKNLTKIKNFKNPEMKLAINYLKLNLNPGDFVTIHHGCIVEIISKEEYEYYGRCNINSN